MQLRQLSLALALVLGSVAATAQSLPDAATAASRVDSALDDVRQSVNNRVTFEGEAADLERLLEQYRSLLSAEQNARVRSGLEQSRAEYLKFAQAEDLERLGGLVTELEQQWQETRALLAGDASPNSRDGAIEDLRRDIGALRTDLTKLSPEGARTLGQRIDAVSAAFESEAGAAADAQALASLEEYWQRDTADTVGWEQEEAVAFATYASTRSAATSAFGMPKTLELFEQATQKLEQAKEDGDAPAAYVANIENVRARSRARLLEAVSGLVVAGEAKQGSEESARSAMGLLDESLRVTLAAASDPEFAALMTRTERWLKAAADADTSSEEGRARYYERMTVSAKAAWPEMERQFTVVRGFDPNDPSALTGQLIRIDTDNLMGWKFKTGDFPFATTISGMPIAATYDPEVAAAIAEVEKKMGRALGDSDDDGRWTVIAEVTGRMGSMQRRVHIDGDIRDSSSGEKLGTYSGEKAETVDAPILRIVAAYVGPLAVARGIGAATPEGSLVRSEGTDSSVDTNGVATSGSWLARVPLLLLGMLAAVLCWTQARPESARALAAGRGQAGLFNRLQPMVPWIGLALSVFGLVWLLRGSFIADLLPALAMSIAGAYTALPMLGQRRLVPAVQVDRLRPFGAPVAITAAVLAGAHLVLGAGMLL